MKLIIDIPEDFYIQAKKHIEEAIYDEDTLILALANGIPLPKSHGRLKDVDAGLKYCTDIYEIKYWDEEVPTIIEADRGVEE